MELVYIITLIIVVIVLIILVATLMPKKIAPIEKTIDDVKNEKTDIEKVIESLETSSNNRVMTTFEEEQEANAIISYQELVAAVKEKKATIEKSKEPNQNLLNEVTRVIENAKKDSITVPEVEVPTQTVKPKFKNSEFISPIFGKTTNNDEFLKELKDFRSNL